MKRGDVREDGRVFWGMNKGRPEWRTPEAFAKATQKSTENKRLRRKVGLYFVQQHKKLWGCEDCGEKDPVVLSLHHLPVIKMITQFRKELGVKEKKYPHYAEKDEIDFEDYEDDGWY
jgi:hypothetical protein